MMSDKKLCEPVVVVDWGTTSFRLWLLNPDGTVAALTRKSCGMAGLRSDEFEGVLEASLTELSVPSGTLVIICGMAGSAQGWVEAPYVAVPASTRSLAQNAVQIAGRTRVIYIVPGLAQYPLLTPDVMRGEETILLGLTLMQGIDGTVCLPGTHSKWANIKNGVIEGFRTSMTGELFALLSKNSTLAHFLPGDLSKIDTGNAFTSAIKEALHSPHQTLQSLFSIRAMPLLLGTSVIHDMPARLSGLLIGLEVAGQLDQLTETVTLVSGNHLLQAYQSAFKVAGIKHQSFDADDLAKSGLFHIALEIQSMRSRAA